MRHLLDLVFANDGALAALIFCCSAGIGQVLHAVKKWADGSAESVFGWLTTGLRQTVSGAIGNIGGMVLVIQSGVLAPILAQPNGWWAIFLFGFMNGFAADSALNLAMKSGGEK